LNILNKDMILYISKRCSVEFGHDRIHRETGKHRRTAWHGVIEQLYLRNFPSCCLRVKLVPEIPSEGGQIVCRDSLDAKTLEVMSYAASFPDSLIGGLNPGTLIQQLQSSW